MYACCDLFIATRALAPPRGARHVGWMQAGRAPRGAKRAVTPAPDFAWTAIAIVVAIAVAVAVAAFYWFIY
jgi:hypothetical protein